MQKTTLWILIFLFSSLSAEGDFVKLSKNRATKLIQRGEKIAFTLCEKEKLDALTSTTREAISKELDRSQACHNVNGKNRDALLYFLMSKESNNSIESIAPPHKSKCPVCGMFIKKYPKWVALLQVGEKRDYFDGVKDTMKYYLFDTDFPYDRKKIKEISVTDFYTLKATPAKEAFYVLGSNVYGPMGDELIPFENRNEAQNFMKDHNGEKILQFQEITPRVVMALDGIEYHKDD